MQDEIWKDIPGYEGLYQVSNLGRVKALEKKQKVNIKNNEYITRKEKIKKLTKDKYGYVRVMLYKNDKYTLKQVHRLVAQAFLDNYDEKLEVNHLDCNIENNNLSNLEMCTRKQNMEYASKLKRMNPSKKAIIQFTKDMKYVKRYESLSVASIEMNTSVSNICQALKNPNIKAKKCYWRYADDTNE